MAEPRLNPDLFGCPLYRKLIPHKYSIYLVEPLVLLIIVAIDFGAIWVIEGREIKDNVTIAQNIGSYVLVFFFTMMMILVEVYATRKAKKEFEKRIVRLQKIPEQVFWDLDAEISMTEMQYGCLYLLKEYLYAPHEHLLIRYADIATWKFGDHISTLSGTLKDQYIDIIEEDQFKTQILVRRRADLVREHDQFKVRFEYKLRCAKYPNGSPYRNS